MIPEAIATAVVVVTTTAVIIASPSWLSLNCDQPNAGGPSECGWLSPLVLGFVGVLVAVTLWFIGTVRRG